MAITGSIQGGTVVTKWVFDSSGAQINIKERAREIRDLQKNEKERQLVLDDIARAEGRLTSEELKLAAAQKETADAAKNSSGAFGGLGESLKWSILQMAGAFSAGQLLTRGITELAGGIKTAVMDSGNFARAQQLFKGDLEGAREATRGLVTDMDIMMASNKLATLGVKLTSEQYVELLGATTKLASAMGRDMHDALDDVAVMLGRGSIMIADNLGIVVKAEDANEKYARSLGKTANELDANEKKLALQKEIHEQLLEKGKALPAATEAAATGLNRLGVSIKNSLNSLVELNYQMYTGPEWGAFMDALGLLTGRFDFLANSAKKAEQAVEKFQRWVPRTGDVLPPKFQVFREEEAAPGFLDPNFKGIKRQSIKSTGGRKEQEEGQSFLPMSTGEFKTSEEKFAEQSKFFKGLYSPGQDVQDMLAIDQKKKAQIEYNKTLAEGLKIHKAYAEQQQENDRILKDATEFTKGSAVGALQGLAAGMWQVLDAAMQGRAGIGEAMLAMTKSILLGIAQQATVKAIFELAEGWAAAATFNPMASAHFTAAGIYGSVAFATGVAGLTMSAVQSTMSPRDQGAVGAGSPGYFGPQPSSASPYTPSFGEKKSEATKQPIQVNLYLGDANNPSAVLLMNKQLEATIKEAA